MAESKVGLANVVRDSDSVEIQRLRSTNPLYDEYKPRWDYYLASYEGGEAFANENNIFRHPREHVDDFKDRVKRIHYLNYCERLVDFFTDFIFSETIQRDGGANIDLYTKFIDDVNKKGEDVTEVMRQVCEDMQIFGILYVLVDSPRIASDTPLTRAQEEKLGIRPYWVVVRPDEVLDWITDEFDKFVYWKRVQMVNDYTAIGKTMIERYTEWTRNDIKISDVDVTEPNKPRLLSQESVPNTLGVVPVETFRFKKSKINKFMGNSFLVDFSDNNREVMNLTSLLQEFLYRQCFNVLSMQIDQSLPVAEQQEGEVGTSNVLTYPKGAERPQYIAPSADPADKLMEERRNIVNEMFKRAAQDTVNELFNGQQSSGYSKAQSFATTVPKIAARAETLEDGENRLMELTFMYLGKPWDGKVKYKDRYEITNITDAITQLTSLFRDLQLPSEEFAKQELKRLVHEMDGQIPQEDMVKIEKQIDAMDFKEWMEVQKEALVGKSNSIAEQQKSKQSGTMAENKAESEKKPVTGATKKPKGKD
jgi:hypothetical protein